jgi:ectoine hydroxylase-related dioxygenase (phytanoyl-CoA dioxygenase family)
MDGNQASELGKNGYTVFPGILSQEQLVSIQIKFEKLMYQQGYHTGRIDLEEDGSIADIILKQFQSDHHGSSGTINEVANLVNEGDVFDSLYTAPELIAAVYHLMEANCRLSELTARETLPGGGIEQAYRLSQDSSSTEQAGAQAIWLLDDFTETNGGLSFLPGSHRSDSQEESFVSVYAPAGSLILVDTRVSRVEPVNRSEQNKRFIYANFVARNQNQVLVQKDFIRMTTYNQSGKIHAGCLAGLKPVWEKCLNNQEKRHLHGVFLVFC